VLFESNEIHVPKVKVAISNVASGQQFDAIGLSLWGQMFAVCDLTCDLFDLQGRPHVRIRDRVAEHVEEEGLGEAVELGEGGAALGSQGVGLVQDGGDAALFATRVVRDL
jgi:hypothetical protein